MYNAKLDNHVYTAFVPELENYIKNLDYVFDGIVGRVAIDEKGCDGDRLVSVQHIWKAAHPFYDNFYTHNMGDVANAANNLGYARGEVTFFCSRSADAKCGATLELNQ